MKPLVKEERSPTRLVYRVGFSKSKKPLYKIVDFEYESQAVAYKELLIKRDGSIFYYFEKLIL